MKQKIVGTYSNWISEIQVVLRDGEFGAEFWLTPGDIHNPRIKLCADQRDWQDFWGYMVHEITEMTMVQLGFRYARNQRIQEYVFIMTHEQFSEVADRVGWFLSECHDDVKKAWKQWKREKK